MNKAIFLDRDGTLNVDINYAYKVEDCKLLEEGIGKILYEFKKRGYLLIITTNQAGIDKGYYTEDEFYLFMSELERQLGIKFDGIYFAPFHPDFSGESELRKPNNGMILNAKRDLNIDLNKSIMIGDNYKDVESGKKSECMTIMINSNNFNVEESDIKPDFLVNNWNEIKDIILKK